MYQFRQRRSASSKNGISSLILIYNYNFVIAAVVMQISLKEKSHNTVRDILSEVGVFQSINHKNIVHFHGVEIHDVSQSYYV